MKSSFAIAAAIALFVIAAAAPLSAHHSFCAKLHDLETAKQK